MLTSGGVRAGTTWSGSVGKEEEGRMLSVICGGVVRV